MIALLAAARAIHFASLMTIFGGSAFAVLLRRAGLGGPPVRSAHLLFLTAASLAVLSGIVWFCLIAGQMSGSWQGSVDPSVLRLAATDTRFGQIFLGRFVALAVLWMICVIRMRPDRPEVWNLAGVLLASLAPISHAAATGGDVPIIRATNDAVHLVTGGFWLGGLIVLMMLVPAHRSQPGGLLGPLRLFSIWGIFVVALLVLTGVINACVDFANGGGVAAQFVFRPAPGEGRTRGRNGRACRIESLALWTGVAERRRERDAKSCTQHRRRNWPWDVRSWDRWMSRPYGPALNMTRVVARRSLSRDAVARVGVLTA